MIWKKEWKIEKKEGKERRKNDVMNIALKNQ